MHRRLRRSCICVVVLKKHIIVTFILENGSQLLVAKQDGTYFDMWSKCWKYFEACLTYIANTFKCA
jgi:hypothetical protein